MSEARKVAVGMLGHGFIGRVHAAALGRLSELDLGTDAELRTLAGRRSSEAAAAARRFGFASSTDDWRELLADPAIELFDNAGPNDLHGEPTIEAAAAGKHLLCEKPLGRDADEALAIWRAAAVAEVTHMCGFNYRFVPAVRFARELLESGELGEVRHFRASYLQDWGLDPVAAGWRFDLARAGSGALGDLGSHIVDLGRFLLRAEVGAVSGVLSTVIEERQGSAVDVDDAFAATIEFEGGVVGTLEASRLASGRPNQLRFEVSGSAGSLAFDVERLNELELHLPGRDRRTDGPRRILVTGPGHPFADLWWPDGHIIGWEHSFVHEMAHLLRAIDDGGGVGPYGADFEDGYRVAEVCEAIVRSAATGTRQVPTYRTS